MKYQSRFCLPDIVINALINFFQQILQDIDYIRFKKFPSSLYVVKKLLKVGKYMNYAVYPSCNTLYNMNKVITKDCFKCKHIEFPNHPIRKKRKPYEVKLTVQMLIIKDYKRHPKLLFLLPSLKMQIISLFQWSDFEKQFQKWTNRHVNSEMMTDIQYIMVKFGKIFLYKWIIQNHDFSQQKLQIPI